MKYLCAIDPKRKAIAGQLFSDNEHSLAGRAKAWDEAGYHVYDCVAELMPGAQKTGERSLDTVQSLSFLHVDIDLKDIETSRDEALAKLQSLPLPLEIRDSGGGFHLLAVLKEPVDAGTDEFDRLNAARKKLTHLLAGDPAPDHAAALLRRVGTHNYKFDPPRECVVLQQGEELDITEIEELIDLLGDEPLFTRKKIIKTNGHAAPTGLDREALSQPGSLRLDIEAAFAAMPPTGAGANEYQPVIIRAMLLDGRTLGDIRHEVCERTITKAIAAGLSWTIDDEREPLEKRIFSCLQRLYREHYNPDSGELPDWLPEELHEGWVRALADNRRPVLHKSPGGVCVRALRPEGYKATAAPPPAAPSSAAQPIFSASPKKKISAIPFKAFDVSQLPPRAFLYGMHYQRGQATCSVGQDGAGKSTVGIAEAIALATARNILGEDPAERCRVWIHNADDDAAEIRRRIAAGCQLHNVPMAELEGHLFVTGKDDFSIRVATGNGQLQIDHRTIACISETIIENEIDVVIFDPLVTLHGVGENDNVRMSEVIHIFGDIAAKCNCAIDLCHHTRKPSNLNNDGEKEFNSDDSRGAGAIRAAVRASRVFNRMSKAEAEKTGLQEEERVFFIRIDRGKANYLPPAIKGNWFELKSVELLNGESVGAIAKWEFPGQEGATPSPAKSASDAAAEHVFLEILKRFNTAGRSASERKGANYAPTLFADEKEAKAAKLNRLQLKAAMVRLLDSGRIVPKDERIGTGAGRYRSHTLVPT